MNIKLILLFIPFFGLSCKNKSDILPSNNCHVKEVIIFPGENQLVYKFEYNKNKKINKIFKYNDDYLLKYKNIETYKDKIIVKSFQNISRFNNQNDTSKFVYTSYNVYKLNSNNLVSEVDETAV